jgi:cytochrome c6
MTHKLFVRHFMVFILFILSTGIVNAGDPMKGRQYYENHCSVCHGLNGSPQVIGVPNFKMGEGLMKSDQQLLAVIKSGKMVMPGFNGVLSDGEILDIIAHIRTFF